MGQVTEDKIGSIEGIERLALIAILSGRFSTSGLARVLGVSNATAARTVAALRTRGLKVVTVRDDDGWHYELRSDGMFRDRWRSSSLRLMAGFAKGRKGFEGKPEDRVVYGRTT